MCSCEAAFEKTHVPQLIDFVRADRHCAHVFFERLHDARRTRQKRDARAGEGDLRRRRELHGVVVGARRDRAAARCSRAAGSADSRSCTAYALSHITRKCAAARFGSCAMRAMTASEYTQPVGFEYFGTHQMPLMHRIRGDARFDGVHVGPVLGHRHRDHLDAERFADREMPVVARHRTQKPDRPLLRRSRCHALPAPQSPTRSAASTTKCIRLRLELPPAITRSRRRVEHLRAECARFRNAEQAAVVARVGAVFQPVVAAQNAIECIATDRAGPPRVCRASGRARDRPLSTDRAAR